MIKNIAYYPSQAANNSAPVLSAVLEGLQSMGIATEQNSMTADAAVIWSVLWAGKMAANRAVYEHYRSQNKPVIVVEVGALHRGRTWKVAVNNVTAQGHYGHRQDLDWDRPQKLGIQLGNQKSSKPEIIIALQHAKSLQVADINDIKQWINDQVNVLRQYSDRPILVRPHPRSPMSLDPGLIVQKPCYIAGSYDNFDLSFDCHAVVNYNSGPGIQAALAGCRPVVDTTSLAHPVSVAFKDIEQPYELDRSQWLVEICHTEYTVDELRSGLWVTRIKDQL